MGVIGKALKRRTEGKLTITGVGVNGLEEAKRNPDIHSQDVQVLSEVAV